MQLRVYLPLDRPGLRRLAEDGRVGSAPFTAYAATTDLRREYPNADDEELEYLAFTDAATAGEEPPAVIAAADVDADVVTDLLAPAAPVSAVRVAADVARRQVASLHVATDGPGYSWYDATELDVVVDLLD